MEINSDESDEVFEKNSAKKRKSDQSLWKRNIIKIARIKGEEYVNYQRITLPRKCTGIPCRYVILYSILLNSFTVLQFYFYR